MTRLLATIIWDVQLQLRYGFYYAGAFVAVIWVALLSQLPSASLIQILPALLFLNLVMTTFYFIAGLVLLEKGQQTLAGLVLTPLRPGEYLLSKVVTLTLLGLLECVVISLLAYGVGLNWWSLILGLVALAAIYTLLGFVSVSRYTSINEYILPSTLVITVLALPLADYFGLWSNPIFYLWPTQPALLLLKGAFQPIATWQMLYALSASVVWLGLGYWWSRRVFVRFILN